MKDVSAGQAPVLLEIFGRQDLAIDDERLEIGRERRQGAHRRAENGVALIVPRAFSQVTRRELHVDR